jgi:hypothetical protein
VREDKRLAGVRKLYETLKDLEAIVAAAGGLWIPGASKGQVKKYHIVAVYKLYGISGGKVPGGEWKGEVMQAAKRQVEGGAPPIVEASQGGGGAGSDDEEEGEDHGTAEWEGGGMGGGAMEGSLFD